MGKHDKQDELREIIIDSTMPPKDWYKERIRILEAEVKKLRADLAAAEQYTEHQAEIKEGMATEFEELMAEKDAEIAKLKDVIATLKESIVRMVVTA